MCPESDTEDLTLRYFAELREMIRAIDEKMDRRFEQVDRRFEQVDRRFDEVDRRFDGVDRRLDNANTHSVVEHARLSVEIGAVRGACHEIEPKQAQLEDRVENCEREIEELKKRED